MKRRAVLRLISLLAGIAATDVHAQEGTKRWRIVLVYVGSKQSAVETGRYAALIQGLREFGYVDGQKISIEALYADARSDQYVELAVEAVRRAPHLIISTATPIHQALRRLTDRIPIVITVSPDPVAEGLAETLGRPGRNFSGITSSNAELSSKYLELLSACVPGLRRVGLVWTSSNPSHIGQTDNVLAAAKSAGIEIIAAESPSPKDVDAALHQVSKAHVGAALILADGIFVQQAAAMARTALSLRLPTLYGTSEFPEAGGMMSYGPDIRENYRRVASFVDRILRGAKAGELPIEQPTRFELVINTKVTKTLGLSIPSELLLRANRVL